MQEGQDFEFARTSPHKYQDGTGEYKHNIFYTTGAGTGAGTGAATYSAADIMAEMNE